jgi:hypothetical protein
MADAGRDAGPELPLPETVGVLMPLASWLPGLGGGAGGVGVGPGTSAAKLAMAAVWKGWCLKARCFSCASNVWEYAAVTDAVSPVVWLQVWGWSC